MPSRHRLRSYNHSSGPSDVDADGAAHQPASRSPRNNGNGNSSYTNHNSQGNGSSNHRASQKQVDYLHQLARQIDGLGLRRLESLCQKLHGKPTAELTSLDASSLIDTLKAIKDGRLSLASALDGAPS